jgi:hypothetical protein
MKIVSMILASMVMAVGGMAGMAGCAAATPDDGPEQPVMGQAARDPALRIERGADEVHGTLQDDGIDVKFSSALRPDGSIDVRLELDGMILTDHSTESEETLDGVNAIDGAPTLLTDVDRAAVRRLLAGLEAELFPPVDHAVTKAQYDELRGLSPAEERLFRAVDGHWSRWPTTVPLRLHVGGDEARGWTNWRRYASTNTTVTGCHDCNNCSFAGDCCDTGKKLGEYFGGANYGNCGTSTTGTQFTKDCTNHDQCVRTTKHGGHALASAYCDDQFTSCVDDNTFAPSCKYDWRGTTRKGNCPTTWNGDGACDCFCQFQDSDC